MAGQGWVPGQAQGGWAGVHGWNQAGRSSSSSQSWGSWGAHAQYGQGGYTHAGVQQWGQRGGGWGSWQTAHSHGSGQGGLWQGVSHGQASHSQGRGAGWTGDGARSQDFSQSTPTQGLKAGQGARVSFVMISEKFPNNFMATYQYLVSSGRISFFQLCQFSLGPRHNSHNSHSGSLLHSINATESPHTTRATIIKKRANECPQA